MTRVSLTALLLLGLSVPAFGAAAAVPNHPVLVEGETDFDGDGLVGLDEDLDGDRVYGTLRTALAVDLGAINNNGSIRIVTSGRFAEGLLITGANGNVCIEAAPGVDANIDAVLAGAPGNVERQNAPGIVVDAGSNRSIILRNLVIRNWRDGIVCLGDSRVTIDHCRVENQLNFGIRVADRARVCISDTTVSGTGFRVGAAGNAPDIDVPMPGDGMSFEDQSQSVLVRSTVTTNFGTGLNNGKSKNCKVAILDVISFDNGVDFDGKFEEPKKK